MKSDVAFHDLGHETVQCPTASCHELQDSGALLLGIEGSLDGVDLSTNPSNTSQKFFFVFFGCMSHVLYRYTIVQYSKETEKAEFNGSRNGVTTISGSYAQCRSGHRQLLLTTCCSSACGCVNVVFHEFGHETVDGSALQAASLCRTSAALFIIG